MNVLVIDFQALFHRSYCALEKQAMHNSKGTYTFGVFGFLKTMFEQIRLFNADLVLVCDEGGSLFRKDWYADYKVGRSVPNEDRQKQKHFLRSGLEELKIPRLRESSYEADDLIATVIKTPIILHSPQYQGGVRVIDPCSVKYRVVTVDQDLLALVGENCEVLVWKGHNKTHLYSTPSDVQETYGFHPNQITEMKALVGDKSDNIPGVRGFGEKAAKTFFEKYKTLKDGYEDDFKALSARHQGLLQENADLIATSYSLAKLYPVTNYRLEFKVSSIVYPKVFLDELEFKSLSKSLMNPTWIGIERV